MLWSVVPSVSSAVAAVGPVRRGAVRPVGAAAGAAASAPHVSHRAVPGAERGGARSLGRAQS